MMVMIATMAALRIDMCHFTLRSYQMSRRQLVYSTIVYYLVLSFHYAELSNIVPPY